MQRVAILIDGWNLLEAADRLKRRVNMAELAHVALTQHPDRHVAVQRFYIGPNNRFGTTFASVALKIETCERLIGICKKPKSRCDDCTLVGTCAAYNRHCQYSR